MPDDAREIKVEKRDSRVTATRATIPDELRALYLNERHLIAQRMAALDKILGLSHTCKRCGAEL